MQLWPKKLLPSAIFQVALLLIRTTVREAVLQTKLIRIKTNPLK